MQRFKTYLAAPLFNSRERCFNACLAELLNPYCEVFLPQRDGLLLADLLAKGVSKEVAEMLIFEKDCAALRESDLLVAVLDGAHVDEGVAFEIGFAHARGCLCLGFQSDVRRALLSGNNPMIGRALTSIFNNQEEMVAYVAGELASVKKRAMLT